MKSWILTIVALLFALLLHAGALVLVNTPDNHQQSRRGESFPETIMAGPPESQTTWEENLAALTSIRNPGLFALPNYTLGFSNTLSAPIQKSYKKPPLYTLQPVYAEPMESLPVELDIKKTSFKERVCWSISEAPLKSTRKKPSLMTLLPLPKDIVWRLPEGKIMPGLPAQVPGNIMEAATKKTDVENSTEIEFMKEKDSIRMRLRNSSGNQILDSFALKLLGREVAISDIREQIGSSRNSNQLISSEPHTSQSVEVEWRAAVDEVEPETEPEETEEEQNDDDE